MTLAKICWYSCGAFSSLDSCGGDSSIFGSLIYRLQIEFQEGKRSAPAFSQVTAEDPDSQAILQDVYNEIAEDTYISAESIASNQSFIRSWIEEVALADMHEDDGKCFAALCFDVSMLSLLMARVDARFADVSRFGRTHITRFKWSRKTRY